MKAIYPGNAIRLSFNETLAFRHSALVRGEEQPALELFSVTVDGRPASVSHLHIRHGYLYLYGVSPRIRGYQTFRVSYTDPEPWGRDVHVQARVQRGDPRLELADAARGVAAGERGYGAVRNVSRVESGSNLAWTVTVEPDGSADVTIALPATTDRWGGSSRPPASRFRPTGANTPPDPSQPRNVVETPGSAGITC